MRLPNILIHCLSFVLLANANNLVLKKKEIKEPKVQVETVRIVQPKRVSSTVDNSFMPVFLTSSNVKASDFTQEMLKSLATNNYIKPSVKLSTNKSSNVSSNKSSKPTTTNKESKKLDKAIKSETVVTRWSKAGSTSNFFSPVLPINLSKMHFDTTGFIPIVPKQSTRTSSNAKFIKQASKSTVRPTVNAKTVPLVKPLVQQPKASSKRKTLVDLNTTKLSGSKETASLPNPSVRALKSIKSKSTSFKPLTTVKLTSSTKPTSKSTNNAKIVDNRPIASASSTELNSYLKSQLNSRDARKALLKMNTLRYLAKLSPQWAASSLSESYQSGGSALKAYPIGKITVPAGRKL